MEVPARITTNQQNLKETAGFREGSCDSSERLTQNFGSGQRAYCQSQQQKGQSSINHFTTEHWVHFWQIRGNQWRVTISEDNWNEYYEIQADLYSAVPQELRVGSFLPPVKVLTLFLHSSINKKGQQGKVGNIFLVSFSEMFKSVGGCCCVYLQSNA